MIHCKQILERVIKKSIFKREYTSKTLRNPGKGQTEAQLFNVS